MKEIKQAIVLVDNYRRPSRRRNTSGRYRVGAKTEKEAVELVRKVIGFGSPLFYYWDNSEYSKPVKYKEVKEECGTAYFEPHHACSNHETWNRENSMKFYIIRPKTSAVNARLIEGIKSADSGAIIADSLYDSDIVITQGNWTRSKSAVLEWKEAQRLGKRIDMDSIYLDRYIAHLN